MNYLKSSDPGSHREKTMTDEEFEELLVLYRSSLKGYSVFDKETGDYKFIPPRDIYKAILTAWKDKGNAVLQEDTERDNQ